MSETARSTSKVWKAAGRLVVLAVTLGSSWIVPNGVRGQVGVREEVTIDTGKGADANRDPVYRGRVTRMRLGLDPPEQRLYERELVHAIT